MGKEKFVYNTQTLRYEKVEESTTQRVLRVLGFICAAVATAFLFTLAAHEWLPSPKEKALMDEIEFMEANYAELGTELERLRAVLNKVQERDAYAHRMVFGVDPIDQGVWEGGVGGHDKYEGLRQYSSGDLMASVQQDIDKFKRQLDLQSRSLDTIINLAKEKEEMLASIPSIKPVRSDKLPRSVRLLSGFGRRIHPIYKVPKMHYGIDFTAPSGTPIQATGAGKVVKAGRGSGYGNRVIIDHGFGYETLYAHMKRIDVKVGQTVKRGQQIGLVGNTGASTAPHCHYEVIHKGQKVNPIHYCLDGLSPEEYQEMVQAAEMPNQSFD
ncbi:M23 family metallopeptidase [Phaeodactylibacter luteus]|uniref:M23 family metallopeptidase n=1 Tax=Phaeodactylibacter luteus TaxID=1564516 RepID=A0A5C6RKW4_9BACT|nr:M23 family metallopeptidase [Phaeodactylibacter luteus]TXB63051.1 M23 family metallopeptidase [Phaeodactylibacter luteus]